jgi:hypothetical protein
MNKPAAITAGTSGVAAGVPAVITITITVAITITMLNETSI